MEQINILGDNMEKEKFLQKIVVKLEENQFLLKNEEGKMGSDEIQLLDLRWRWQILN